MAKTLQKKYQNSIPAQDKIKQIEVENHLRVYPKRDVIFVRGEGSILFDIEGHSFIDCASGWGVANIGHANPAITNAITNQAAKLISNPGIFYSDIRANFIEKLIDLFPDQLNRVFLTNSGTESIEAALKFAMVSTKKSHFIAAMKGFHGRSLGALSVTHKSKYKEDYQGFLNTNNVSFFAFNKIEKLRPQIRDDTAAIILECVQGEGGVYLGDPKFFKEVRKICDEKGILLIIDEIQTGFSRTGKMFAFEWLDIVPDIVCFAKSVAGGVPMGGIVVNSKIVDGYGKHGSTFGGNPLACAAGIAAIDFIKERGLVIQSLEKGDYFLKRLTEEILPINLVRNVRGKGLMLCIELRKPSRPFIDELLKKNIVTIPTGSTMIRLLPPLVISYEQIDDVIRVLKEVLDQE